MRRFEWISRWVGALAAAMPILAVGAVASASDGVVEINRTCAVETG